MSKSSLSNQAIVNLSDNFFETIYQDMGAILVTKKLSNWYTLSYDEFCKELGKLKVNPVNVKTRNWATYFEEQKLKATQISSITAFDEKELVGAEYQLVH